MTQHQMPTPERLPARASWTDSLMDIEAPAMAIVARIVRLMEELRSVAIAGYGTQRGAWGDAQERLLYGLSAALGDLVAGGHHDSALWLLAALEEVLGGVPHYPNADVGPLPPLPEQWFPPDEPAGEEAGPVFRDGAAPAPGSEFAPPAEKARGS